MYLYLSESQKVAVDLIRNGDNVFITGPAGTGKSYLLQFLKKEFSYKDLHITATTGIAAVNVSGTTLHFWAGLGTESFPLNELLKNIFSAKGARLRKKLQSAEILAIDEISMLSKDTFDLLNELLKNVRQNENPFGGIQLILFGDFFQLPPVKSDYFCFESEAWLESDIKIVQLTESFRQKDIRFLELLNNIRFGLRKKDDIALLKERFLLEDKSQIRPTILSTHNYSVEKINFVKLNDLSSEQKFFKATYEGNENKIEFLKKNCIAQDELYLKIGAQVMMLKNTYQKDGIINGSMGIVVNFSNKKQYPIVEFENGKIITITPEIWEITSFNKATQEMIIDASMCQIPLRLAWAITVHKSQGMTIEKIECDLKNVFTEGQVYVALSRVKEFGGLYIKSFDINNIKANEKVLKFYNELKM